MPTTINFNIGIPKTTSSKIPSDPGYASDIKEQFQEVQQNYASLIDSISGVTPEILKEALQPTKTLAEYYTPKKTGALVRSSYLEITDEGRDFSRVELGFASGGEPPYAAYVHEMVEYHHAPPTRAKFLQAAVMEDFENIKERVIKGFGALGFWRM